MTGPKARVRRDMGRGGRFVGARLMRALWHDRDGSALLEGALVMPLLIALMLGVYEFSWYFYQQHLIAVGVRDAARYLARSSDACDATSSQWASEAAYAQNLATTGFATGGPGRVKGWTSEMIAIECTPIDNRPGVNGLRPYRGDSVISRSAFLVFSGCGLRSYPRRTQNASSDRAEIASWFRRNCSAIKAARCWSKPPS
jgi:hypothetical protein